MTTKTETITIGKVHADQERTHLVTKPGRAKCGSALDTRYDTTGQELPSCETCLRYAGLEIRFACDHCDLIVTSPIQVDEVWHLCSKKPGKGGGRRRMRPA